MSYQHYKRFFDVFFTLIILFIIWPFLLFLYLMVRIFMGYPAIFKQLRPGLHEQPFYIYKFRTMHDAKDKNGVLLEDGFRLTRFGTLLRRLSLDELPGLINVIKGEMSLVGPRPLLMDYLAHYSPTQKLRHTVRPGITGWAQVNGRNALSWEKSFELDVWYVKNISFLLDLKIIFLTIYKVIKQEGIHAEGYATMPRFDAKQENI